MTCKECMHYEVCIRRQNSISLDPMKSGYKCPEFKNKADFVEVKRGKWEKVAAYNDGIINTVKCSICKEYQPIGEWDWQAYCPRCGAKMEGAET